MKIDSERLKALIIDNAVGETVSLTWVFKMITRAEQEVPNYIKQE